MLSFVRNHKLAAIAIVVLCLVLSSVVWSMTASVRGQLVADFDTNRGRYEVLAYGLPSPWRPEYTRLLRERYDVEVRTVALCIVSRSLLAYADSYNAVSTAAANRKFGHDIFKECAEEARQNWEQTAPISEKDSWTR